MTDRISECRVIFDYPMSTDDAEEIMNAIKYIKCVADVNPGKVMTAEDYAKWKSPKWK